MNLSPPYDVPGIYHLQVPPYTISINVVTVSSRQTDAYDRPCLSQVWEFAARSRSL